MRLRIYQRLWEILSGKDATPEFQKLPPETKRSILEILTQTKAGLPEYSRTL